MDHMHISNKTPLKALEIPSSISWVRLRQVLLLPMVRKWVKSLCLDRLEKKVFDRLFILRGAPMFCCPSLSCNEGFDTPKGLYSHLRFLCMTSRTAGNGAGLLLVVGAGLLLQMVLELVLVWAVQPPVAPLTLL